MTIKLALQKTIDSFWEIQGGRPDITGWLYMKDINPDSKATLGVIVDFVDDYAAFKIKRYMLHDHINHLLKMERWRFVVSTNTWIKL